MQLGSSYFIIFEKITPYYTLMFPWTDKSEVRCERLGS